MPMQEVLRRFSALLQDGIDAVAVVVAIGDEANSEPIEPDGEIAHVLRSGKPIVYAPNQKRAPAIYLPIAFGGKTVGALGVTGTAPRHFDDDQISMLESCVVYLGARIHDERSRADRERLERIAFTDQLTGLANRRAFDEALEREWHRCARSRSPLSVLMLDVDFFKIFNDTYGHVAGDGCLKQIAQAVGACIGRPGDVCARYGGEEFAVVLPETSEADAARIGESIAAAVRATSLPHLGSSLGIATVSIGCASVVPDPGSPASSITELADAQLYRAKENGRNRVASASHISEAPSAERVVEFAHNLPSVRAAFLGREAELAAIAEHVRAARHATLVGPGGVGKTRLAIEFGNRSLADYSDGVWFVDLAPVTDPDFVANATLAALKRREAPGQDAADTLSSFLREKAALLIFDNCEQVVVAASNLAAQLLQTCPEIGIVATSREALGLPDERVCRLPVFEEAEAVALFASRARVASPSFSLTERSSEAIKRICKRLDRIPLAIEIAAARVRIMPLEDLANRLDERFDVLSLGARNQLARHQTVRELVEWSYLLLEEQERTLLRRLSVFAGNFAVAAASEVCAFQPLQEWEMLDLLEQLIDKSLLLYEPLEGRYWLLESTKEFGREQLRSAGEDADLERRRIAYLRTAARNAFERFVKGAADDVRSEITRDYAEYRAALQWALGESRDVVAGAELAGLLGWYWQAGLWSEGRHWHEAALARAPEEIGMLPYAIALQGLANLSHAQGDYATMESAAARALEAYRELDLPRSAALARNALAIVAKYRGDADRAQALYLKNVEAFRAAGDRRLEALTLQNLGELLTDWKLDYAEAERLLEQAVRIHRERGDTLLIGAALGAWSANAGYSGAFERAAVLADEALEIFRRHGEDNYGLEITIVIAQNRLAAGDADAATVSLCDALSRLREKMHEPHLVRFAEALAELALVRDDARRAATLLAFSDDWRAGKHLARPKPLQPGYERSAAAARTALGDAAFATACEHGRLLYPEAVLASASEFFAPP
jgi:non-specific serine/threonine protein kinase